MSAAELSAFDSEHVWHPYGAFPPSTEPLLVESASGVRLRLADGRELIDGMSSWWAAIHGYRHPRLDAALAEQSARMSHVMFGGLTHAPAIELSRRLVSLTPAGLEKVFLADSGSVAVEVALKMAVQWQRSRGLAGRSQILTWRGGYHGDTLNPMSVCDPDGGMHAMWTALLPQQHFVPAPPVEFDETYAQVLREEVRAHADELAAVIVEPLVQGAGGMRFHDAAYLRVLREECDRAGIALIFDEIASAFGRIGGLTAAEIAGVEPDIMCLGKAITGGYMTLAATLTTDRIASEISAGEAGGLAHGPTFMGNPLACAVGCASLDILAEGAWRTQVPRIEAELREGLALAAELPGVRDVRVRGAVGVVELDRPVPMQEATDALVARGVWLRPFRNLIYTMPPFVSSSEDIAAICAAAVDAARVSTRDTPEAPTTSSR
ncbi:adenosylmethionine--8-amino-7-oxononanoate transaminase [Dietzia sp.]|uniref:adenosylmethionine--8-amino-7-oxononanoate transaminase n=1 Tax=Dietzia sp. TaxID=1871616 RepID=UPI002FDA7F2C